MINSIRSAADNKRSFETRDERQRESQSSIRERSTFSIDSSLIETNACSSNAVHTDT